MEISVMGEKRTVTTGITYKDLSDDYRDRYKYSILLAKIGNTYRELSEYVNTKEDIQFVDLKDSMGNRVYVSALIFLLSYSVSNLFGFEVL